MIYVRILGGLGNQMFQYAAGHALAHRLNTELVLDFRENERLGPRPLTAVFDLTVKQPERLPPDRSEHPVKYGLWRLWGTHPKHYREAGLGYNARFSELKDETYLHGYWQTEKYFAPIAQDIRECFRIVPPASAENRAMADRIANSNSISLHVRRGDYLTTSSHGVCTEGYYLAALDRIREASDATPTVFVFSDEPEWAHDNLELPCEKIVVDLNGPSTDYEDLRLMSLCQHNILANSSFSWWGAWLNENPDKIVVGPEQWFADKKLSNPDILPDSWLRV